MGAIAHGKKHLRRETAYLLQEKEAEVSSAFVSLSTVKLLSNRFVPHGSELS